MISSRRAILIVAPNRSRSRRRRSPSDTPTCPEKSINRMMRAGTRSYRSAIPPGAASRDTTTSS